MNSTKQKRQKTGRRLKFTNDDLWGYIFIAAAMIIFCVFTLYPVFSAIYTSFFNYKPFGSEFVGLKNYVDTLKYSKFNLFYKAAGNTLIYTVIVVPLSLLLSFAIAVMIMPFKKKTQSVFKAMYYLPALPPAWRCPLCGCGCMIPLRTASLTAFWVSSAFRLRTGSPLPRPRCSP